MLKKMKLGTKIAGGFGIVLILSSIIALVGWWGMNRVVDHVEKANGMQWVNRQLLAVREDNKSYIINGDKKSFESGKAKAKELTVRLQALKARFEDEVDRQAVDAIVSDVGKYDDLMNDYVALDKKKEQLFVKWGDLGREFTKVKMGTVRDVLEPAMAKAHAAKDIRTYAKMVAIKEGLNADVNQAFLLLRVSAVYAVWRNTDQTWENFQKRIENVRKSLDSWNKMIKGYPAMGSAADKIDALVDDYLKTGSEYHRALQQQTADNQKMLTEAEVVQKKAAAASARQQTAMNDQIGSAEKMQVSGAVGAIVLGILVALFITIGVLRQLGCDPMVIEEITGKIAQGDLTLNLGLTGKNSKSVYASLKTMLEKIQEVIVNVKLASENVSSGSNMLSASSEEMSQGATEQAAAAEEASSARWNRWRPISARTPTTPCRPRRSPSKSAADARKGGRRWPRRWRR